VLIEALQDRVTMCYNEELSCNSPRNRGVTVCDQKQVCEELPLKRKHRSKKAKSITVMKNETRSIN